MELKLNLGCGALKMEGFVNIDIRESVNPDLVCDVAEGLPYEDGSVDYVLAKDFLEHIIPDKVIFVIEEIWRVLKHDGGFESFTPDCEHGQGAFQDPTHRSFWCENSWLYYSGDGIRKDYGIKANFLIQGMQRANTDFRGRVYHLHVMAKAIKEGKERSDA